MLKCAHVPQTPFAAFVLSLQGCYVTEDTMYKSVATKTLILSDVKRFVFIV